MSAKQPNTVVFFWDNFEGPITQYVTALLRASGNGESPESRYGLVHQAG